MIGIFFIIGLALADKLDRTYLPPPGSKFSGGSPGAIQVPLEDSKLQYSLPHPSSNDEYFKSPQIAIGIDRLAPKRPITTYSSTNNSSTYPENTFIASTTINPYPQNTDFPPNNGYSTVSSIDYTTNYSEHVENPDNVKNSYQKHNQPQHISGFNENQFPTTENYSRLFQGNVSLPDINRKDIFNDILYNQSKNYGDNYGIVNTIPQTVHVPLPINDFVNNQYNPGQYSSSSIPTIHPYTNFISSTLSPSTVNYDFDSTIGPKQFYSSTLIPPHLTTITPKGSKNYPVFNYANIKKRPERIQAQADREASILNYESSITPEGYAYSYDTSNGIHGDESGVTVDGVKAQGSYSYIGDDGKLYNVVYTADEYGFRPRGDHLPTSPPIPDAILKVIEQVSKEKEAGIVDDGSYDENKYGYRRYHNGFYSPKSDFSKVHPAKENKDKLIKTTKNITPNYNRGVPNQIVNKNYKVSNENPKSDKYKITMPIIDEYSNSGNNFENINSNFPLQHFEFQNKSGIKHIEPYVATDLETGEDANNRLPSNSFKQIYKNPTIDNEKRILDTTSKAGTLNDFTIELSKENKLNGYNNEDSLTETGYQYNPPKYTQTNKFPSRFSDVYDVHYETLNKGNVNKDIPKPFLTPYVMRTDDETEHYEKLARPFKDPESEHYEDELNSKYPSHPERTFNDNDTYNTTDLFEMQHNKSPFNNVYALDETKLPNNNNNGDNGYVYEQRILESDKKTYDPFPDSHSYTSSTIIPNEFTSRINTIQSDDGKFRKPQSSTRPKSTSPSTTYIPDVSLNKTPDYTTSKPGYIDQYTENVVNENIHGYPKTGLKNLNLGIEFSTNIPVIGNSYAPNLHIINSDEFNLHPTTEHIIGEDFSGPKQSQSFDPLTGYYYK